ncbi:MAG: BatD family protein [Methylovulum sp.]|nr:BatD family protein [Methylovulum sp.]
MNRIKVISSLCRVNRRLLLSVLVVVMLMPEWLLAAQISTSVDRDPVSVDDSFQIMFVANGSPDDDPDFSPLEQDFSILSRSQASSVSLVNGKASKTMRWTLDVMAKHAGALVIPAIKFGDDTSEALPVKVIAGATDKAVDTNADLFMEVEATPESPYLQAQVLYTMRLYTRVEIAQARLNEPELADAVIEKLAEDSNFNTRINGVDYSVTERKYALFPQKSGTLTIKPLVLTADVLANNRTMFNSFFNSSVTRTKRVESKPITLDVKPAPATFTGAHWLPAEQLELTEQWSGDITQMKVGEPLTRTLTVRAKAATVGQLPELSVATAHDALKSYPDQPVLQEQKNADGLLAIREEKIALMPSKAGTYQLPAIEIPWFNTQTQKMAVAKIPETTLTVTAAVTSQPPPAPVSAAPAATPKPAEATAINQAQTQTPAQSASWMWVSLFLALGWLITVVYFLSSRGSAKKQAAKDQGEPDQVRIKEIVSRLKQACANNDAVAAKNALLDWGKQQFDAANLGAVAGFCEARLRDEILSLNQLLYGKDTAQWQGKKLFQAFSENNARKKITGAQDTGLEPLFRL